MKKTFLATLALTLVLSSAAFSQVTTDSVYLTIDQADHDGGVQDGAFTMNVWISISTAISGGTLGFAWSDTDNWKIDTVIFGPAMSSWEIKGPVDTAIVNPRGSVLIGGAAIFSTTAAGSNLLFATIHFSLKSGNTWTAGDEMNVDSVNVPPAGDFVLIRSPSGTNFVPTFVGEQKVTFSDVGDEGDGSVLPSVFSVAQNYPNPFNPDTKIDYSVASRSLVKIEVYNLLGQKVRTLLNEEVSPADQNFVVWRGNNDAGESVASGVYFYKMTAGDFVQTRKMMLMK